MVVEVCKRCGDVTPTLKGCGWRGCLVDRLGRGTKDMQTCHLRGMKSGLLSLPCSYCSVFYQVPKFHFLVIISLL